MRMRADLAFLYTVIFSPLCVCASYRWLVEINLFFPIDGLAPCNMS